MADENEIEELRARLAALEGEKAETPPPVQASKRPMGCLGWIGIAVAVVVVGFIALIIYGSQLTPAETLGSDGKRAVKSCLRDPSSARFGDTWIGKSDDGTRLLCGTVSGRNGFGGYAPTERFVSGNYKATLESEMPGEVFNALWDASCTKREY